MNRATVLGAVFTALVVLMAVYLVWPTRTIVTTPAPNAPTAPAVVETAATTSSSTIGRSVEGRIIEVYTFGTGDTDLLLVGGIHGGYEANTVRLADEVVTTLRQTNSVPQALTVHIIPNLNPDGYALPASASDAERRFNANAVDLNRNFDCRWQPTGTWRGVTMSAGTEAFSEPEAAALRDYVLAEDIDAAVFWHSRANAVYTSECGSGVLPLTDRLMNTYAANANYQAAGLWTAYPVTGDAEGWLASIGVPAITVELETRDSIEWPRNWAATMAIMDVMANEAR